MSLKSAVRIIGISAIAGCGAPGNPNGADAASTGDAGATGWSWIDVPESICGNGTPTGIGVNLAPQNKDILIYMEGGGACWNEMTCFTIQTATHVTTGYTGDAFAADPIQNGWFADRARMNNPARSMNYVYIPYCTGDLHAGDVVAKYDANNPQKTVHHKGSENVTAFIKKIQELIPHAERIFATGVSAGAFGAQLNFPKFHAMWPDAEVHLLADSGQLITPPPMLRDEWLKAWKFPLPADCTDCTENFSKYAGYLMKKYPNSRFSLLAFEQDYVLQFFFQLPRMAVQSQTRNLVAMHYDGNANARYFLMANETSHGLLHRLHTLVGAGDVSLLSFITGFFTNDAAWINVKQ